MEQRIKVTCNLSKPEIDEINVLCINERVSIDVLETKSLDAHHVLELVFTDFSPLSFVRDAIFSLALDKIVKAIRKIASESKADCEVEYDDFFECMGKKFFLKIVCNIDQVEYIKSELDIKLSPRLQGIIPDESTLYVRGTLGNPITILVVEKTTGKQYYL